MMSFNSTGQIVPAASMVTSIQWVRDALLGSVATAVATVAVGSLGYLAFNGHVDIRRAWKTILGCFIIFAAPSIAAGIRGVASDLLGGSQAPVPDGLANHSTREALQDTSQAARDPYAGAAVGYR
ncbi:TrbC/VirB2 family protein [Rhizorhabdus sp. FW153]|uniref:TrbC/VirB2 family protein n=1 Tax=Rhizorhabdus sp. FW153 TaxID=3400216 RepID=UPI003CEEAF24